MSFDGISKLRPMPRPRANGCAYCGRASQPTDAVNCCGCGAPLQATSRNRQVPHDPLIYTAEEIERRGDDLADYVEVTTMCDYERRYLQAWIPNPVKK